MKKYSNIKLKKFIDFFYLTKSNYLPSSAYLSKELGMTKYELQTLITHFISCNFLYKHGNVYSIFQTKRNFTKFTQVVDKGTHIIYSSPDYSISLNKFEMETLEPNFKIETIEDLIYMLFLFTIEFNILIHPKIYLKNNEFWYKKECKTYKENRILYMCEFTQHSNEINLINTK